MVYRNIQVIIIMVGYIQLLHQGLESYHVEEELT